MNETKKKVSFQLKPEIKILYTWAYAHRMARKGMWHIDAVDRMRFQRRIEQSKNFLDPVLISHLSKIKIYKNT